MARDFISIEDYSGAELVALLDLADELKRKRKQGEEFHPLKGQTLAMLFEKPSLRTRVTFEVGIFQLGGNAIFLETELGAREPIPDVARNLDRWVDGIVARTHSHDSIEALAKYASAPVINALSDKLHPCQIMADAQTLREHKGKLDGLKVAFVGDGNNVCASWAYLATRIPIDVTLVCPEGYELNEDVLTTVEMEAVGNFSICHDPAEGVKDADVVYTDVWASMGQESETAKRKGDFAPYQVNGQLMAHAKSDALFMHCLPAHRGDEVTDEVIESSQSVVFDEAENRLHAQKAVMVTLMGDGKNE